MFRAIDGLTGQHDWRLVALAATVCVASCFIAFWLYRSALVRKSTRRHLLMLLAGTCTAAGIWTTHFVAMLAYDPGLPISYDVPMTLASLAIAVCATTLGLAVMSRERRTDAVLGGLIIGLGIAGMHYCGMASIVFPGRLVWDLSLVMLSIAVGTALTCTATFLHATYSGRRARYGAPAILTLGVCALHFTVMGAATLLPDASVVVKPSSSDATTLALMITWATTFLMLAGIIAMIIDRFTIARGMLGFSAAMLSTLAATIGVGLYTLEQVRIGGSNFQRISAGRELVADILPPPAHIIEAYLEARIAITQPERHADHQARLASLRQDYLARREHWQASRYIPNPIKQALVHDSDAQVGYFWHELDHEFLPALARKDTFAAMIALDRLTANYLAHRMIAEELVAMANAFAADVERNATSWRTLLNKLAVGSVLLLIVVVLGATAIMNMLVIKPVLVTASYLKNITDGHFGDPVPFAKRKDEIGTMAKSIETLRLASIDKVRLEAEAEETRRRADEARAARDKERTAEALRLHLANESITSLNADLSRTIEQLKQAQDEIVRKGRLAQLGQLTATVAHEIRNPLGAVKTAAFLIERKTRDKGLGIEPQMQRINNGIQRCDTIITELLDFTRSKAIEATAQSLDGWVAAVIEEERRSLPADVAVTAHLGAGGDPLLFDGGRMRRVLINLLTNAAEAMVGKGGDPKSAQTANPAITVLTRLVEGNVEIIVSDNGPGISPENLAKIREPLFTTKSFGVGLGLPAVEKILEQHGGGLRIESTLGEGATMTAWFPARPAAAAAAGGESGQKKVA